MVKGLLSTGPTPFSFWGKRPSVLTPPSGKILPALFIVVTSKLVFVGLGKALKETGGRRRPFPMKLHQKTKLSKSAKNAVTFELVFLNHKRFKNPL